jgi:hypothetical protein
MRLFIAAACSLRMGRVRKETAKAYLKYHPGICLEELRRTVMAVAIIDAALWNSLY